MRGNRRPGAPLAVSGVRCAGKGGGDREWGQFLVEWSGTSKVSRYLQVRAFDSEWQLQAVRVEWRIVKDWVEAQLALIETRMVTAQQVFLPYAIMRDGRTLS